MDRTNLIYNGDFSLGTDSWNGSDLSVSNGELTVKGNLSQSYPDYLIPVANGRRYRLTYDIKFNSKSNNSFYIALYAYDSDHVIIPVTDINKPFGNTCDTTLAEGVKNGDTTVTLTDASNWPTSRRYQRIGICNIRAWDYNRNKYSLPYSSIDGNVVTLNSAWAGGTYAAGTKVSEFEDGGTYFYPHSLSYSALPDNWKTYTAEFNGGDPMRYSTQYFRFATLGYSHNYSMRNIRIECINDVQLSHWGYDDNVDLKQSGVLISPEFNDVGMPIRYVRDTINGSTDNQYNHWSEIAIYNYVGENIALCKNVNGQENTVVTDGIVSSDYISSNGTTATIDIGYIENVHKIKIWHYYPDGRTYYNNVTEVSVDGTNWITVYKGQKPETADGNEIILTSPTVQLQKNGEVFANEIIEL